MEGIKKGKVGIGEITRFDTKDYKVKLAAEVKDFDVKERLDPKRQDEWKRFLNLHVAAEEGF